MYKKDKKQKEVSESATPTGTQSFAEVGEAKGSDSVAEVKKISKLDVEFPSVDMNKVVEKINKKKKKSNG